MKQIMDGCTAATHVAFALSDVATIYPITPVASMGETAQKWGMQGRKNYMGMPMSVKEMESELGAAGATHGAAAAGALATTFTNSQGLMLMISNMYKIAGNRLPVVFHVGARSLATHALSIFGDHQDVMATRATGFAFLCSTSVQEVMDLATVAHLAALEGSTPVCHFFDGWRTSNEMSTIDVIPYNDLFGLIDRKKVQAFRARALNPEHPVLRGSAQNPDVYFQNAEAQNPFYDRFPAIVQEKMDALAAVTGRQYHLFDYHGAADATTVVIAMGSSCKVAELTVDYLNSQGYKAGVVTVHLFRPFSPEALIKAIPPTVRTVVTLDRTKEPGADGEPLYKDVATALLTYGPGHFTSSLPRIMGGRYGLSSKDFTPAMVKAILDEAAKPAPRRFFTVGITDDVTKLSLDVDSSFMLPVEGVTSAIFYGFGSDGTVGATRQAASIIGDTEGMFAQAYFSYSAKKSGGYTISQLRFSKSPVEEEFGIEEADYVACHKSAYVDRFHMLTHLKHGGVFVLNCPWKPEELADRLPAAMLRELAARRPQFYIINAEEIAHQVGLGNRINTIMETVFMKLTGAIDFDKAISQLKSQITKAYMHEGGEVVAANLQAIDRAIGALVKVEIPDSWADAHDSAALDSAESVEVRATSFLSPLPAGDSPLEKFVREISAPCLQLRGDSLPVSLFKADGRMPMGTTAFERRRIAYRVPQWDPDKCVECTECSFVCPHAAIRPFLLTDAQLHEAPAGTLTRPASEAKLKGLHFRIQTYPEDCTGCSSCATICPGHALTMVPMAPQADAQRPLLRYCREKVGENGSVLPRFTINGSQFQKPLLEFSGACAGCGETPYIKLLTQLFGERMIIANATGCSSVWGANYPSNAYCTRPDGRGAAWGNSLFEDNAEYGYGMAVSCRQRREGLLAAARQIAGASGASTDLKQAAQSWIDAFHAPEKSRETGIALVAEIRKHPAPEGLDQSFKTITDNADLLGKPSVWAIGGDGWAYDIGFAGLDHVLASGENINLLVMDTECYSNTGGQTSKATPLSAVTKYSPDGKRTFKKDLGRMMMSYGTVYVASIALGANMQQAIDAMREAEAYPGPSLIICYCPCINHGIRAGMGSAMIEERRAVATGYWQLYRYNPLMAANGLDPYILDSLDPSVKINDLPYHGTPSAAETTDDLDASEGPGIRVADEKAKLTVDYDRPDIASLDAFLDGEDRYADLRIVAPDKVAALRKALADHDMSTYNLLINSPEAPAANRPGSPATNTPVSSDEK